MFKRLQGLVIGVLITSILFSSTQAAESITKMVEVAFNSINLKVNSKAIKAENILYNNTTYVPLRTVAEMLGKEVKWDGDTNTASINDNGFIEPQSSSNSQGDINDSDKKRIFADMNIELFVRKQLGKLTGEISKDDLASITSLYIAQANISNIEGLQYLVNLESLELTQNSITDISIIKNLKKLKRLGLFGNNITDINPIKELISLESLNLRYNSNLIDIKPLTTLVNLKELYLTNTSIKDINPLVENIKNGGFKTGYNGDSSGYIMLHNNALDLTDKKVLENIQFIVDKGVNIEYIPQRN